MQLWSLLLNDSVFSIDSASIPWTAWNLTKRNMYRHGVHSGGLENLTLFIGGSLPTKTMVLLADTDTTNSPQASRHAHFTSTDQ